MITTAEFHPSSCSLLAYGSSSGLVRLVDLRRSALCDYSVRMWVTSALLFLQSLKISVRLCLFVFFKLNCRLLNRFQDRENRLQPSTFFTEIISCITDLKFTGDGKYLLTRDYMNLKVL